MRRKLNRFWNKRKYYCELYIPTREIELHCSRASKNSKKWTAFHVFSIELKYLSLIVFFFSQASVQNYPIVNKLTHNIWYLLPIFFFFYSSIWFATCTLHLTLMLFFCSFVCAVFVAFFCYRSRILRSDIEFFRFGCKSLNTILRTLLLVLSQRFHSSLYTLGLDLCTHLIDTHLLWDAHTHTGTHTAGPYAHTANHNDSFKLCTCAAIQLWNYLPIYYDLISINKYNINVRKQNLSNVLIKSAKHFHSYWNMTNSFNSM